MSIKVQVSSFKFQVSSFKYQASSIKLQVSSFKYQVPLESGAVGRRWTRRCPSPRRRCPPQTCRECKVQKSTSSFRPTPYDDDVDEDTTDLVSAVESRPSASPLANDLRAGGPGGEGGAGGIPGT